MSFFKNELEAKYSDVLDKAFGIKNSFCEFNPGKIVMPPVFEDIAQKILNAEVRKDDIWLISYPRTGSTWTQEIVWLIGNKMDFEKSKSVIQQFRAPMIELSTYFTNYKSFMNEYGNSVDVVNNMESPRYIKSHLPLEFLPTKIKQVQPKIIYITRHPKDLCVSFYHHCQLLHNMNIDFEHFAELFLHGKAPLGSALSHSLSYWNIKDQPNILYLKYEELKKDTRNTIRTIANFMEKEVSNEDIDNIYEFLTVDKMKHNPGCNLLSVLKSNSNIVGNKSEFIRKGVVGDWENYMDERLSKKFDEWIDTTLNGTGLIF